MTHGQAGSCRLRHVLSELAAAAACAEELSVGPWNFAIRIDRLLELGLSRTDLRFLICSGIVEHRVEDSLLDRFSLLPFDRQERTFLPPDDLQSICPRSAFVILEKGLQYLRDLPGEASEPADSALLRSAAPSGPASDLPRWNESRRELSYHERLVKRVKSTARNQLLILRVFEEEGWPVRIDDPLPPARDMDPKNRLHDTIKTLNRHHVQPLLRFSGDGHGHGICWSCVATVEVIHFADSRPCSPGMSPGLPPPLQLRVELPTGRMNRIGSNRA